MAAEACLSRFSNSEVFCNKNKHARRCRSNDPQRGHMAPFLVIAPASWNLRALKSQTEQDLALPL